MRHYETTYILRPNLGEDQFTEIIERTNGIITDHGGAIINLERWGMKQLAYEIKKEMQGYYVYVNYAVDGDTIAEIERIFKIDDRLLRFLTIKLGDHISSDGIEEEKERIASLAESAAAEEQADEDQPAKETADDASAGKDEKTAQSDE